MNALQISLLASVLLFQGIWAKPSTAIGELYEYSMKSGELSLQAALEKTTKQADEQANDPCECAAHIYEHPGYRGRHITLRQQNANFGNDFFHDRADSIKIDGNCKWIFYEHSNFGGSAHLVRPGTYSSAPKWAGRTDRISSARALPPDGAEAIALFEHRNYQGRMVVLTASNNHLPSIEFDDTISSFIMTGGSWEVYEHPEFTGRHARLSGEEECRDIHSKKFDFRVADTISSVKKIERGKIEDIEDTKNKESLKENWSSDY